ncbi:GNAT family N-acetyltransferase [Shumkonia mesophila]|uniref:GNAT family N-acetyltransferase n=1 Tax=Shumkonia mesophila TaxID=2838854 RepID=UPI0029343D76|nr:GNAT family N-acetyltransferase [Shumkonia mesophila]
MSDALTVRPVAAADFAQWLPLWVGYHRFYGRAIADDVTRVTWGRFFDAYEPLEALVAEAGGGLIGLAHTILHRNTSMIAPVCYMQDLFVAEEARGHGVGRALIEAVYARARAAGLARVYWQTHETNATAQALYDKVAERSGFIQYRKQL